ncbi:MAG: hypothetical protein ACI4PE_02700 [Bacilli bacterium]
MEEDRELDYPYYEMTYFDDNKTMHLAKVKDKESVSFLKQRFEVKSCNFVNV